MTKRSDRERPRRPPEARLIETPEKEREIEAREAMLDDALEDTFPASDPLALQGITCAAA
jgi:hypothetical protein